MVDVKGKRMSEEDKSQSQGSAETATAGADAQNNNTSNGSEADKTQKTGESESAAQKRIRQLVADNKGLQAKLSVYEPDSTDNKSSQNAQRQDGDDIRSLRLEMRIPEHLKNQADGILSFGKQHPTLSPDEVIKFFDSSFKAASAQTEGEKADADARASRTGGNSNSAVRNSSAPLKEMKDADLEAELKSRMASGEKF